MRPFTHDGDDDLPFDEDDEWDLEYGDEGEGGGAAEEIPDDDWEAASTRGGSMRVRIFVGWGLAVLALCVAPDWARAADAGTPPAANPDAAKASPSERLEKRFQVLDANGNGVIEESEFTVGRNKETAKKRAQAAFQRMDTDKNGGVSKDEFLGRGTGKAVPAKAMKPGTEASGDKAAPAPKPSAAAE